MKLSDGTVIGVACGIASTQLVSLSTRYREDPLHHEGYDARCSDCRKATEAALVRLVEAAIRLLAHLDGTLEPGGDAQEYAEVEFRAALSELEVLP